LVAGVEIAEVEIKDLWYSSDGAYLELTGNVKIPVPPNEVERIRDFLEHRNDVLGIRRKLNFNGQEVFDDEILDLVYENEKSFIKLTDGRLIEIEEIQTGAVEYFVSRNKKLRGET
jgi:hypothetical protein